MLLDGAVITAPDGVRGIDADATLQPAVAAALYAQGYRFCVRYVRRLAPHARDLTHGEAAMLLATGLGLMAVQHVASENAWTPDAELGAQYGETAALEAEAIGIPAGVNVWCDLEGVAPGTPAPDVIAYCNRWHAAVAVAGFVPGLYVGWHCGLSPVQLYRNLRFTHYWSAYNLNVDERPAKRGVQMLQSVPGAADRLAGHDLAFQVDTVRTDALGGRPVVLANESWLEL